MGDLGSISGSERFPGEGNGNQPQYSCLKNSMNRGAWQAIVHGVAESDMTEAPWDAHTRVCSHSGSKFISSCTLEELLRSEVASSQRVCVCVCVCIYYIFIHSSVDGHLDGSLSWLL